MRLTEAKVIHSVTPNGNETLRVQTTDPGDARSFVANLRLEDGWVRWGELAGVPLANVREVRFAPAPAAVPEPSAPAAVVELVAPKGKRR